MIHLVRPTPEHAPRLVEAVRESMADLHPWMEWAVEGYGVGDALEWIADTRARSAAGGAHEFLILDETEAFVGTCGVNRIDPENRVANLGYWIRSSRAGSGMAPLAARMLVDWAFANTTLHRLEILVAVGNHRSQRVAEKVGAIEEGVLRARLWLRGIPHDATMSSIVRGQTLPP